MPSLTIEQAFTLALQHHTAGRFSEAEAIYRQILAVQPGHARAAHLLGQVAYQTGRNDLAAQSIREAIRLSPNEAEFHYNLGVVLQASRHLDEAITAFHETLRLDPLNAKAATNLGNALMDRGRLDEAIDAYRRAIALAPADATPHNNLGTALREKQRFAEALAACRRAIELEPNYHEAHNNLGTIFLDQGRLDEAIDAFRSAIRYAPGDDMAWSNLGNTFKRQGRMDEAIETYRRAVELKPDDALVRSNLVYSALFSPRYDRHALHEERALWAQRHEAPCARFILPHHHTRDPQRRLRIGYVSPNFQDHVIGRNLLPLFEHHDHSAFEIFCYSETVGVDAMTARFQAHSDRWWTTTGITDAALAERIRADGVDILVDLAQHLAGNRLTMFARQPAPVQASFAGYPDGTGLKTIAYRITDRHLEPSPASDGSERLWFIDSFWCYAASGLEVEVNELPAITDRTVTFGCLNNFCKVNEGTWALWARVISRVPGSRLIVLSPYGIHRADVLTQMRTRGIDAERIEFVAPRPRRDYFDLYHRLDVALDTFPYNGHTTNLDALWMGVPVVSLTGETPVSRAGLSILTNLGLTAWAARTEDEYVGKAVALAEDLLALAQWRAHLRERIKVSMLMDASHFTRQIEQAYREMWRAWCEQERARRA